MKICIFSRPFYPAVGGLEEIAKTLACEFSSANCDVEVVTDTRDDNQKEKFPFKIKRTSSFRERYLAFRRSDVVLFMNFTFAGVPLALLARRPIVLSHHVIYRFNGSLKIKAFEFTKRQLTLFFSNISVSHFVAKNIPGKSVVVPNAYDSILFQEVLIERINDFVFCGRLVSDKGADVLLDAFRLVVNRYPKATLTIIGDGPEKNNLQKKSKSIGLFGNINFTGILRNQNLAKKLREHSCMVIPSLWDEPFGIVALEGIASCDTVISSNRGGLPEAVGLCGLLIDPTVKDFAQAMISVLHSRGDGMLLPGQPTDTQRALHLKKHLPSQVAQRYLDVCQSVLKV